MPNTPPMLRAAAWCVALLCPTLALAAGAATPSCPVSPPLAAPSVLGAPMERPVRVGDGLSVSSESTGAYDPQAAAARRAAERETFARLLATRQVLQGAAAVTLAISPSQREAIEREPGDGRLRVGTALAIGRAVQFAAAEAGPGDRTAAQGILRMDAAGGTWETEIESPQASALRLQFVDMALAPGVELYVYNDAGQVAGPYLGQGPAGGGEFWSDSVFGDRVRVHLRAPSPAALSASRFTLAHAMHFGSRYRIAEAMRRQYDVGPSPEGGFCGAPVPTCALDAMCALDSNAGLSNAVKAVAHLQFVRGGSAYICTGTLLNSVFAGAEAGAGGDGKPPYLLTANHCISSQSSASSLEAFFHYHTLDCFGTCAWSRVQVSGATLLSTGAAPSRPDFTLLQLSPLPAGSGVVRLGWTTETPQEGWYLLHLSHPEGSPLAYSFRRLRLGNAAVPHCTEAPEPGFLYSGLATQSGEAAGAVASGSSGSAALILTDDYTDVQVVGQLYGHCPSGGDVCDPNADATVDGAFRATFPYVQRFLVESLFADGFD